MTRINVVPPSELHTKHLVAEYRELPRVFKLVREAQSRGELPNDPRNPTKYTLGAGHVRFFYDKLSYLFKRQVSICGEMERRGITVNYYPSPDLLDGIRKMWQGDYEPTPGALYLNRERIKDRMPK
uniref:Endonuclease V N-glycosylase UV repair enzyme n=1 Tax=Ochrobactrum phage ORM_20 TaxID=2985243 RepID=A0A9N6WWV6_9VIRU|nr:endonuclease V N-glycosylase UV repair enzyme [Ochrobactrum phage ORM_20]